MSYSLFTALVEALNNLHKHLRAVKKNRASLTGHSFYSERIPADLAAVKKAFLQLKRASPATEFPEVAAQLAALEPLVTALVDSQPLNAKTLLAATRAVQLKTASDLAAVIGPPGKSSGDGSAFVPADLLERRHGPLRQVLWEANHCYEEKCYNAAATMLRRLIESLLIEAFEAKDLRATIATPDGYLGLEGLINRAVVEPAFRLTAGTKRVLPSLKFLGDVGAHNPRMLVRKADLDKHHQAVRAGIEELVRQTS